MSQEEEADIIKMLRDNVDLFVWKPLDIPGIDLKVVCHQLSLDPSLKVMVQGSEIMEKKKGRWTRKRSESS